MLAIPSLEYKRMTRTARNAQELKEEARSLLDGAEKICDETVLEEDVIYRALGKDLLVENHFVDRPKDAVFRCVLFKSKAFCLVNLS